MILITGASGFIGRHIVKKLLALNLQITLISRTSSRESIQFSKGISNVVYVDDLFALDEEQWYPILQGIDAVLHCAWYAEPGFYLDSPKNMDCLVGTIRLAKASAKCGIKKFVGIGTCFEYEISDEDLSTETPLIPATLYGSCKASSYMTLNSFFQQNCIDFLWCRLFHVYGQGEDQRKLSAYIHHQLNVNSIVELGSGEEIRDFVNVDIVAEKVVAGMLSNTVGAFNICTGEGLSVKQFATDIAEKHDKLHLLKFNSRSVSSSLNPPRVVGVPSKILDKPPELGASNGNV